MNINQDIDHILLSKEETEAIVTRIANEINRDYAACKRLVLLCILKGSAVFMGDLIKKIHLPIEIDFMKVSSYGNATVSSGTLNIIMDLKRNDISDLDLLVIEDIIDSGRTLNMLVGYLKSKGARSVRTCTLLDKPSRRVVDFTPDYVGCEIPDEFVVGYGLDFAEKYRNLPYVGVLKKEIYE